MSFWMGFAQGAVNNLNNRIENNRQKRQEMEKLALQSTLQYTLPKFMKSKEQAADRLKFGENVQTLAQKRLGLSPEAAREAGKYAAAELWSEDADPMEIVSKRLSKQKLEAAVAKAPEQPAGEERTGASVAAQEGPAQNPMTTAMGSAGVKSESDMGFFDVILGRPTGEQINQGVAQQLKGMGFGQDVLDYVRTGKNPYAVDYDYDISQVPLRSEDADGEFFTETLKEGWSYIEDKEGARKALQAYRETGDTAPLMPYVDQIPNEVQIYAKKKALDQKYNTTPVDPPYKDYRITKEARETVAAQVTGGNGMVMDANNNFIGLDGDIYGQATQAHVDNLADVAQRRARANNVGLGAGDPRMLTGQQAATYVMRNDKEAKKELKGAKEAAEKGEMSPEQFAQYKQYLDQQFYPGYSDYTLSTITAGEE